MGGAPNGGEGRGPGSLIAAQRFCGARNLYAGGAVRRELPRRRLLRPRGHLAVTYVRAHNYRQLT